MRSIGGGVAGARGVGVPLVLSAALLAGCLGAPVSSSPHREAAVALGPAASLIAEAGAQAADPAATAPSTLLAHGPRTRARVALTFDMGGRVGDARAIVRWLIRHDVPATIFMTGAIIDSASTDAARRILLKIERHPDLLVLGSHSYTHRDFRRLSSAEIREELTRTEAAIARSSTLDPRPFFRPPYGGTNDDVLAEVGAAGYAYTVTWDVDTIDWRPVANDPPGPTAGQIVAKVLRRARNGSIVLMHLGGYETLDALPAIVRGLRAAGYRLVTVERMVPH